MFVIRNRFPFRFTNVCPFPGTKYMTYTCAYYGCTYAYFYVRAYMTRIYMRTKKKVGTCIKCTHVLICTRIRQSLRAGVRRVFTSVFPCDVSKSNTMDGAESLRISHDDDDDDYDIILYARVPQSNGRDDRRWESYRARPSTGRGEGVGRRADTRPTAWVGGGRSWGCVLQGRPTTRERDCREIIASYVKGYLILLRTVRYSRPLGGRDTTPYYSLKAENNDWTFSFDKTVLTVARYDR